MSKIFKMHLSLPLPPLTLEQKRELDAAAHTPYVYDEDCPVQTEEQLKLFRPARPTKKTAISGY